MYSAKETYHFKKPTNRSHPMVNYVIEDVQVQSVAVCYSVMQCVRCIVWQSATSC